MKYAQAKQILVDVAVKLNGNLSMAPSLNNKITVDTSSVFNLAGSIPKLGRDYAFMEKANSMNPGQVSGPVKGQRGYFLIKLLSKTQFDNTAYQAQRNQLRDAILQEKKSMYFNQWLAKLKKDAKIVDNRAKVYTE
jgi:parvulin-like peptidyl-prolyl isomerase